MLDLHALLEKSDAVVRVELADLKGSVPREIGATIYVAKTAIHGTIGGGQLEYMAIDEARRMVRQGQSEQTVTIPLGPEIGQCCGGVVTLHFSLMDQQARFSAIARQAQEIAARPDIYIFGAGHVGRALAATLALLPVRPVLVDSRANELKLVETEVEQRCTPLPEAQVRATKAGSGFVIMTHDHALDFLLAREALLRGDAGYVGMIGSKSKRGTFAHWLKKQPLCGTEISLENLLCPIGAGGSRDKRPAVIAAMVAAELMTVLDEFCHRDTSAGTGSESEVSRSGP